MPLLPILERWRRDGLRVDIVMALKHKKLTDLKLREGEKLIEQMLGPFFNWRSPKQVAHLFYDIWGLPKQYNVNKKTREKHITIDADARDKLRAVVAEREDEKARAARALFGLLDFCSEQKKLSEYYDRISPDDRIHAGWKGHGAVNFRLASTPNVQNWPTWPIAEGFECPRAIVIPDDDDDVFLMYDFEQVELWTYMRIFNIKYLQRVYESGDYIYGKAYEDIFKRPFFQEGKPRRKKFKAPDVEAQDLLRAKAIPLGVLYGRSGASVALEHGWLRAEGESYRADWFRLNPELPAAHSWIQYEMTQKGFLRPPPGFLLHFPQPTLLGYNCFGATPAAALLLESVILMEREFARRGWKNTKTKLCVHDSLLINVAGGRKHPERVCEVHEEVCAPILTRPIDWLDGFQYRAEAKVGTRWDWGEEDYDEWTQTVGASNASPALQTQ